MTSREAQLASSKLLPGIPAATWSRVIQWAWALSTVFFVVGFAVQFFPVIKRDAPFPGFALVIVAALIAVVLRIVLLAGIPREKAEVRAGYTTLPRKYPNLEQIDPKTGAVVRAAGDPYLPRSRSNFGLGPVLDPAEVVRPSLFTRLRPTLIGLVVGAAFVVIINVIFAGLNSSRVTILLYAVPIIFAVYALAALIGSLRIRRSMQTLRAAAPSDFAFMFGSTTGLAPALQAIVSVHEAPPAGLMKARRATASTTGITFWHGDPLVAVGTLPWSRVISVQQDVVSRGRYSYPSVVISFRDDEADEVVALQLVNADANYLPLHSVAEARWIAWELNQLRTSGATARLI